MKYLKIVLSGFKYIAITGYDHIEITPKSPLQLILGTNGSGKTSLMREISPLPGEKDGFKKGGYKEVTIAYQNEVYVLKTMFTGQTKCSFIRKSTEEELNPGGTQQVQLSLIKEILHYDNKMHNLLHGLEYFTLMSPSKRRDHFTSLSSVNYQYALGVWERLKERQRDALGGIRTLKQNLLEETNKSKDDVDVNELHRSIETHNENIRKYQDMIIQRNQLSSDQLKDRREELKKHIEQSLTIILKARARLYHAQSKHLDNHELNDKIEKLKTDVARYEGQLHSLSQTEHELTLKLDELNHRSSENIKQIKLDLDKQYLEIQNEISVLKERYPSQLFDELKNLNDVLVLQTSLNTVMGSLDEIFSYLPSNEDNRFNLDSYNQKLNSLTGLKEKIEVIDKKIHEREKKLDKDDHRHDEDEITCPRCEFTWLNKLSPDLREKMRSEVQRLNQNKQELNQELTSSEQYIKDYESYRDLRKRLRDLLLSHESLKILNKVIDKETLSSNPISCSNILNTFQTDINHLVGLKRKEESCLKDIEQLNRSQTSSQDEINKQVQEHKQLENKIAKIQEKLLSDQNTLKIIQSDFKAREALKRHIQELDSKVKDYDQNEEDILLSEFNSYIKTQITQEQTRIGELAKAIQSISNRQETIKTLESNLNRLQEEEKMYGSLIQEISPTSGLIADGLTQFINIFISMMNGVIKKIWTYPLSIKAPSFDEHGSDLNYKFPMIIGNDQLVTQDVSQGSSGIKEVVNLAYKLTALQLSGMSDYPLFLDEFGATFDLKHRSQASHVIKSIIEQKIHTQLFMISHYNESYGGLVNADILVLSKDNIVIPNEDYNQHVIFSNTGL